LSDRLAPYRFIDILRSMTPTTKGDLLALSGSAAVGLAIIPAKASLDHISSETLIFYLFVFAFFFSLPPLLNRSQRQIVSNVRRDQLYLIMGLSVLFSAAIFFSWTALKFLEPATQSFLSRIKVFMTVILAIIVLKERLHRLEIAGGLLAAVGILVFKFKAGADVSHGVMLMLISAVLFSAAEIMLKSKVADIPPSLFLFYRNMAMIPCFAVILRIRGESFGLPDWKTAGLVAAASLLGPIIGRGTYIAAIRINSLSRTVLINQTQPLFAGLFGFVLLGSLPTLPEWIGGFLVLAGALVIQMSKKNDRAT